MKLYLDLRLGASGDMLMAALLELSSDPNTFLNRINGLGIPGARITAEKTARHGAQGTHVRVLWNGHEEQSYDLKSGAEPTPPQLDKEPGSPMDIESLISSLPLSSGVIADAIKVVHSIFMAESRVHGVDLMDIHQSRLGTMDAVIDVVGVCMLMDELRPECIVASPVHVGRGQIICRGGILPVPASATELLLQGIPYYSGNVDGELCTPTGAALLKHFVNTFEETPYIEYCGMGCGIGTKDFGHPGGLKAYLIESAGAKHLTA